MDIIVSFNDQVTDSLAKGYRILVVDSYLNDLI